MYAKKHGCALRGFSLCLSLLLLLLSAVSCADTGIETADSGSEAVSGERESEAETADPGFVCDLPDKMDFNTEVNYLYTKATGRSDELVSEGYGLGVVSDAVYERNAAVSDRLGVTFGYTSRDLDQDAISVISNMTQAGDASIDIYSVGTYVCMTPVLAGSYLNLNAVPNIDLSKSYWNRYYNEMMTFTSDNLQFVATSPTAISIFRNGYLTIFNRDMLEERKLPDIYEAVNNGDWTLEYQCGLIQDIYVDTNGDSKRDIDDLYGFIVGNCTDMDVYAVSSDIHLVVRDENGDLVYNAESFERLVDMGEKVSALCHTDGTYLVNSYNEGFDTPVEKFARKNAVMATTMFGLIEKNIEDLADIRYGIAPIPKLTKEQKTYGTYIQDQVSSFGISSAVGDDDRKAVLGAVMEAMSYYSYKIVRPAYYDVSLSLRFMQDPQSQAILNLMFESISFDYTYCTSLGSVRDSLRTVISSAKPNIASGERSWKSSITTALKRQQKTMDKLKKTS